MPISNCLAIKRKVVLPETNSSHLKMAGWNTNFPNWDGLFSGDMFVSGSVVLQTHLLSLQTHLLSKRMSQYITPTKRKRNTSLIENGPLQGNLRHLRRDEPIESFSMTSLVSYVRSKKSWESKGNRQCQPPPRTKGLIKG